MVRTFTEDFKLNAIKLVLEEGMKATRVASDLGIKPTTLYTWISRFKKGHGSLNTVQVGQDNSKIQPSKLSSIQIVSEKQKIQDLERQLKRLTMERDILKKAMAYCIDIPK